ncbi:hypothetical protein HKX48_009140 [Thoreauomyces humboldtii]|nr:hypothetical protein HKX48_009140 [Thoreauomyces humboldtii]
MRAVVVDTPNQVGKAEDLKIKTIDKPAPQKGDLLVKVQYFALNRMDIEQRNGKYPVPAHASKILGVEFSGLVEATGPDVTLCKKGDRVCGLLSGGCYAEYVLVPEALAIPVPESVSMEKAAAFPEAQFTAYQSLFWTNDLKEGEDVLIHAGASGVGLAAIQLAKWKKANRIIATAGTASKLEHCKSHGATHGINYKENPDFSSKVAEITDKKGVDVIVDFIGASYFPGNLASLATDGRLVLLGFLGGMKVPELDLMPVLMKRLKITGSTLRSRNQEYQAKLRAAVVKDVLPLLAKGELDVRVDKVFDWEEISEAHKHMEGNHNEGKIVVKVTM